VTNPDPDPALIAYRGSAHQSFTPPSPEAIVAKARRRTRNRVVLAAAAVMVVVLGGAAAASTLTRGTDENPPVTGQSPTPTSTPSSTTGPPSTSPPSSAPPSTPPSSAPDRTSSGPSPINVRTVDWENTTIRFPTARDDDDCLTGQVKIVDGVGGSEGDQPHIRVRAAYDDGRATFGDLNGDGRADAVVYASCPGGLGDEDASGQVLVVTGRTGQLVAHWVGPVAMVIEDTTIAGGRLTITFTTKYIDPEVTQERTYRWNGTRFVQVAGPTAIPS
jgi:hypothetical protein